jgi:hypothetical protein
MEIKLTCDCFDDDEGESVTWDLHLAEEEDCGPRRYSALLTLTDEEVRDLHAHAAKVRRGKDAHAVAVGEHLTCTLSDARDWRLRCFWDHHRQTTYLVLGHKDGYYEFAWELDGENLEKLFRMTALAHTNKLLREERRALAARRA